VMLRISAMVYLLGGRNPTTMFETPPNLSEP
jgi:hypothetical protein